VLERHQVDAVFGELAETKLTVARLVPQVAGEIVMQVEGGKETRLRAGETFYESPTDIHTVSRNASRTQPAKFLVFFLKNAGAPASMPVSH